MKYSIILNRNAKKSLRRMSSDVRQRVEERLQSLSISPRPNGVVKLWDGSYRFRHSKVRIIYFIFDDVARIDVAIVEYRRQAYRHHGNVN